MTGEQYRARREELGLTQMQTASIAGLSSQGVVSQIENGYEPGPSVKHRLHEALGLVNDTVTTGTMVVTS